MLDTPNYNPVQLEKLRRFFHGMNHFMVFLWKIGLGPMMNMWPSVGGRILVIRHRGRRSGREYLTPVNYALVEGEIYSAAGFGAKTDWYRNVMACSEVELWLPQGRRRAHASDASDSPCRIELLREIVIASGFAGPLMGVDQRKLTDEQIGSMAKDYRIVHFTLEPQNALPR
ncbi:MAG TPA: nitroreductase/quinone reductase family protein [Anaerolineales bacterium]|nr:nitroreductase/quinone reductase family protein [Anaerolineales bacterium]